MKGLAWAFVVGCLGVCAPLCAQEIGCGEAGAPTPCRQIVSIARVAGGDVGARIVAAQARMGAQPTMFVVDQAGVVSTAFTLGTSNSLQFSAPVTIAAQITLGGENRISCVPRGSLQVVSGAAFQTRASGLELDHCTATGDGSIGATLLDASDAAHVRVHDNRLMALGAVQARGGGDLRVESNQIIWPAITKGYGIIWANVADVVVSHNTLKNVANGVEFFNEDADPDHKGPFTRAAILLHPGHAVISDNTCVNAKACYWGSVGHDILMTRNDATNCEDVCYDLEGSVDSRVEGNRGRNSGNGVGATFFFTDHVTFTGNDFSSSTGSPVISIHNSSLRPDRNRFLLIQGNKLTCLGRVCAGVKGDPSADLTVDGNHLTNAMISLPMYGGNTVITNNDLIFSLADTRSFSAIAGPFLLNGAKLLVAGNVVKSVPQQDQSACISDTSGDFNSNVTITVSGNQCLSGFPIDLLTENSGTNNGTGVATTISGNVWNANRVIHVHKTGNRDVYERTNR